jgi:hypothetical protein
VLRNGLSVSLNEAVREACRAAGTQPIDVEDRFSHLPGNTHCVTLALR